MTRDEWKNCSQEFEWAHVRRKGVGLVVILLAFRGNLYIQTTTKTYLELEWSYCISCESFYLRESPACNTPVESNFNAIHLSNLTFVSQFCLVDILRRLLRLSAIMIGKEGIMVEVYQRLISVHTLVISKTIGI